MKEVIMIGVDGTFFVPDTGISTGFEPVVKRLVQSGFALAVEQHIDVYKKEKALNALTKIGILPDFSASPSVLNINIRCLGIPKKTGKTGEYLDWTAIEVMLIAQGYIKSEFSKEKLIAEVLKLTRIPEVLENSNNILEAVGEERIEVDQSISSLLDAMHDEFSTNELLFIKTVHTNPAISKLGKLMNDNIKGLTS